jgi:hypothetical protein
MPTPALRFTQPELDMLTRTADALSAYLGRPVLAEVDTGDDGAEWVTFGSSLDRNASAEDEALRVQLGGKDARLLGQSGGLPPSDEPYDCRYLWAIQLSSTEGERFVKIDADGEESAWSDNLADVLPFSLEEEELPPLDDEEDEDE